MMPACPQPLAIIAAMIMTFVRGFTSKPSAQPQTFDTGNDDEID